MGAAEEVGQKTGARHRRGAWQDSINTVMMEVGVVYGVLSPEIRRHGRRGWGRRNRVRLVRSRYERRDSCIRILSGVRGHKRVGIRRTSWGIEPLRQLGVKATLVD